MSARYSLAELAQSLIEHGPSKALQTSRRIRAIHNHITVVDTTKAVYVWEHDNFPTIYVPLVDIRNGKLADKQNISVELKERAAISQLIVPAHDVLEEKKVDGVLRFFPDVTLGPLSDLVRIDFRSIGTSHSAANNDMRLTIQQINGWRKTNPSLYTPKTLSNVSISSALSALLRFRLVVKPLPRLNRRCIS
jgi:hypothetical protein